MKEKGNRIGFNPGHPETYFHAFRPLCESDMALVPKIGNVVNVGGRTLVPVVLYGLQPGEAPAQVLKE